MRTRSFRVLTMGAFVLVTVDLSPITWRERVD